MFPQRLHAYVRAFIGPRASRVGPFLVGLDDHDPGLFRNYAVPDDGAAPTDDQVGVLIAFFADRDRTPRLEYLPELCPALEPRLLAAGFRQERRPPVMTCPPDEVVAVGAPDGIEIALAVDDDALRLAVEAQNEAYGQAETTEHDIARSRGIVEGGGLVALAVDGDTGLGVGGGVCAPPHDGVSELAGVGVRAAYRRRGIATALTAFLTRACPGQGIATPFLTPAGEDEERLYRAVGYRTVTDMVHISRR